jgi:AraC family transcriptional regulator
MPYRPSYRPGRNVTSNPVERLTAEWRLAPAAALSDLPYTGMAVMRWTCRTALKREFVSRVGDGFHVFSYILRNSRATSWLDGRQVWDGVIPAHGLRILPPAAEPRWLAHSAFDSMQFHVPVDALRDMADGRARSSKIRLKDPLYASEPSVTPLVHAVASALDRHGELTSAYVDGLAIALLSRLVSRFSKPGFDDRERAVTLDARLRRAIDFINTHLADDLRLATISAVAGLSPYHFSHLFTATMGIPPHRYLLKRRIERARQRLLFGREAVIAIALDCGFKDASHFARVFARETGLSPRRFRQMG